MFQILTDDECGLSAEQLHTQNVEFISYRLELNGQPYDVSDLEAFFAQIKQGVQPETTQINIGQYIAFFEPYVQAGTPILFLGLSSGLSGSYASSKQAQAILLEKYPDAQIEIVDSRAACAGEGRLILEAIRLRDAGSSLTTAADWLTANRLRLQQWFTVDSLDFLFHGGRISRASATLGTLLKIKPLLDVDPTGKLRMVTKIRTRKRALKALVAHVLTALASDPQQPILIATSGDWPAADWVKAAILKAAPNTKLQIGPINATIASHTGFGCVAVFVMGPEIRE